MKDENLDRNASRVEDKLLLLFLLDKMEIPISGAQLQQFALQGEYMNYATLMQTLREMDESGFVEVTRDDNTTRYSATDEGITTLEYFEKKIPLPIRNKIVKYVADNRKDIKKEYEITANYFYDHPTNEFIVKCGIYEDEIMRMEISFPVVTRNQARLICKNWKNNVSMYYGDIISELVSPVVRDPKGFKKTAEK
ncbi:MAG: DUF4364 family protein [Clostridiales bacterium]|jgi:DNA-binding PadR family transcriptional regulator|nr:DUF4364 family protein [Clostridiales bacterium]